MIPAADLPPLRLTDLRIGRQFGPDVVTVTPTMVAEYIRISGDADPLYNDAEAARSAGLAGPMVPFGLLAVLARWSYLGAHRMLPGGVMAGQDITFGSPGLVGRPLTLSCEIVAMDITPMRRAVVLDCRVRDESHQLVGRVVIDARWPEDDQ
jgi:acyl dehydratase